MTSSHSEKNSNHSVTNPSSVDLAASDFVAPAFILASVVSSYPDERFKDNVSALLEGDEFQFSSLNTLKQSFQDVKAKIEPLVSGSADLDEVRSMYIDIFDRGRAVNSLYETEYGRDRALVKGTQLVDIAGFYRAFGFETGGDGVQPEMIDHLSVELEFYALLLMKNEILLEKGDFEGVEIVLDARKKFLKSHLGRFVVAVCERPGIQENPFYSTIFKYCRDLVLFECDRLDVQVDPESWIPGQHDGAATDMTCGGSVGCTP